MTDIQEWDLPLKGQYDNGMRVKFPAALQKELELRGFTRCVLRVTHDGLLVVPYRPDKRVSNMKFPVELPESWAPLPPGVDSDDK